MKATNYLVTYTDLTTMGLAPKGSPATGNRIATKLFITTNYYVDETASPFAGYSNSRCPAYQTIIPANVFSLSYYNTQAGACLNNDPITIISSTNPIGVGSLLYLGDGSQAFTPYYYSDGSNWYYADSNVSEQTEVISTGSCGGVTYSIFYADEYVCSGVDCSFVQSGVLVALDNTITPSYSNYYVPQAGGPQIFQLTSSTPTGPGVILSTTSYASCIEICGV